MNEPLPSAGAVGQTDGTTPACSGSSLSVAFLVDHLNEVIFRTDCGGHWLSLNSAWSRLTGYPIDECLGRLYTDFVHPDDRLPSTEAFQPLIRRERETARVRLRLATKSGEHRWVGIYMRALFHPLTGRLDGAVGTIDDISELMAAERVMKEEKDRALLADRTKSQFLASMSHELRTPMNAIIGLTDLVLTASLPEEQAKQLRLVRGSAASLLEIIDEVLLFSNLDAGRVKTESTTFNCRESMGQALAPLLLHSLERRLELQWQAHPDLPNRLQGDALRLKQLVHHLVGSAVRTVSEGRIHVTIGGELQPDSAGLRYTLRIEINCPKLMGGDDLAESFRVARGDSVAASLKRQNAAGVSLVLSLRLLQLMQGRMHFKDGLDGSICIAVEVPVETLPLDRVETRPPLPSVKRTVRLLVAEDNTVNQHVIRQILNRLGHESVIVANGRLCVDEWERQAYDGILMDIQMPEMSGLEATRAIREIEKTKGGHIPIIAVTANAVQGDRENCLRHGMDDYISKPIKNQLLEEAIYRHCVQPPINMSTDDSNDLKGPFMNFSEALSGADDDQDLLRSLLELFLNRTPEGMKRLEDALTAEDSSQVMMQAHSLKGALRMLCAPVVEDLAYRIEKAGRAKDLEEAAAGLSQLKRALPALYEEIGTILKEKLTAA